MIHYQEHVYYNYVYHDIVLKEKVVYRPTADYKKQDACELCIKQAAIFWYIYMYIYI